MKTRRSKNKGVFRRRKLRQTRQRKQRGGNGTYADKSVLVTGGAGFIGSHIVDALLAAGAAKVRVLDSMDPDSHGTQKDPVNLNDAFTNYGPQKVEFLRGDIRDFQTCVKACEGMNVVFHEAAMVSVPKSIDDPLKNNETNITGTLHMLKAAADAGVSRFVFASSAATYGMEPTIPKQEVMKREYPSPYALSKGVDEDYAELWAKVQKLGQGMTCVALRYFNVFGPRQNPKSPYSGVISIFADRLTSGDTITFNGDGTNTRDFVFVKDVVKANLLAGLYEIPAAQEGFNVFNVGTGKRTSLLELLDTMQTIWGTTTKPNFGPERQGDIKHSVSDISKIRSALGYEAEYSLADGLQQLHDSLVA